MSKQQASWASLQSAFSACLQNLPKNSSENIAENHSANPPVGLTPYPSGKAPQKRFNVYRNNVTLSLINILTEAFPVCVALVGEDFFKTLARHFAAKHLPKSPLMFEYGADLPAFIKSYEPCRPLPYLEGLARLEWARHEALFAADAPPAKIDSLSAFEERALPGLVFDLHPALRLVEAPWPIVTIWQAHQQQTPEDHLSNLPAGGEAALITRPELSVLTSKITPASACFIKQLAAGHPFAAAAEAAMAKDAGFNIGANLASLFHNGAIMAVRQPENG